MRAKAKTERRWPPAETAVSASIVLVAAVLFLGVDYGDGLTPDDFARNPVWGLISDRNPASEALFGLLQTAGVPRPALEETGLLAVAGLYLLGFLLSRRVPSFGLLPPYLDARTEPVDYWLFMIPWLGLTAFLAWLAAAALGVA